MVKKAGQKYLKSHRTPTHQLLHTFNLEPNKVEKISLIGRDPKWKPKHRTHIPKDKEKALKEMETVTDDIMIYTDGS